MTPAHYAIGVVIALAVGAWKLLTWQRDRARAEAHAQEQRADTAEAGRTADREADRRETQAHVTADRAIPVPATADPATAVAEIEASVRRSDHERAEAAAKAVKAKIGKGPKLW